MRIIYAPKNEPQQTFNVTVDDLLGPEADLLEESGGNQWDTYGEWLDRFSRGGWRPMRALVWILLRRNNPTLEFDDLSNLTTSEVFFVTDEDEVEEGKDESGPEGSETGDAPTSSESPTPDSAP